MGWGNSELVAYFIVGSVSILGSIFVATSVYRFGASTLSTRLVLYLHTSQILQDIFVIPQIYRGNNVICKIAGWGHTYSGMCNIIVVTIMCFTYRHLFFNDKYKIQPFFNKYLPHLVFGFPLVSLAPFISDDYGPISNSLCSFTHHSNDTTSNVWFALFIVWSVVTGIGCLVLLLTTVVNVYQSDVILGAKLLKSIGVYALATLMLWLPRFVLQLVQYHENVIFVYFLIFAAGIVYVVIFLREKQSLKIFEQAFGSAPLESTADGAESSNFSWDDTETDARMSRERLSGTSVNSEGMITSIRNPILNAGHLSTENV